MRKILFTITIAALFLPVFAYMQVDEEQTEKPLNIYEAQKEENRTLQADLIQEYGQRGFNSCFVCSNYDLTNPFSYSACLREIEACLTEKEISEVSCLVGQVWSVGKCVSYDEGCRVQYGEHSYASSTNQAGKIICNCATGFGWNGMHTKCIQVYCGDNEIYYTQYKSPDGEFLNGYGRCLSFNQACQSEYGEFSEYNQEGRDEFGDYWCRCQEGHKWEGEECVEDVIVLGIESEEFIYDAYEAIVLAEKELVINKDNNLAMRLSGMILLQVENNGEAWYVNPINGKKYFLSSPSRALNVMQKLGLGVTHEFMTSNTTYPGNVVGKILIDVEDYGKAYYIYPGDRHAYYLGKPGDALLVMHSLGLGITNDNIRKIEVGEF